MKIQSIKLTFADKAELDSKIPAVMDAAFRNSHYFTVHSLPSKNEYSVIVFGDVITTEQESAYKAI